MWWHFSIYGTRQQCHSYKLTIWFTCVPPRVKKSTQSHVLSLSRASREIASSVRTRETLRYIADSRPVSRDQDHENLFHKRNTSSYEKEELTNDDPRDTLGKHRLATALSPSERVDVHVLASFEGWCTVLSTQMAEDTGKASFTA